MTARRQSHVQSGLMVLGLGIATPASANGAMGLALSTFEWPLWLVYVGVTVVLEALLIGAWLRVAPLRALGLSVWANTLTGQWSRNRDELGIRETPGQNDQSGD